MLLTVAAFALIAALQEAPVTTAPPPLGDPSAPPTASAQDAAAPPAAATEPPPPLQLVPTPEPIVPPAPPADPIDTLLAAPPASSSPQAPSGAVSAPPTSPSPAPMPPLSAPSTASPSGLPAGPQPYRGPSVAAPVSGFPAQSAPTPITAPESNDEDAPDLPAGPRPYLSLPPTPAPVGPRPFEASGYMSEGAYEARVRGSAQAAQSQRGSLDGSWLVTGVDGARLYVLQLSDDGRGTVEGAWRDANGLPGLRSGFITSALREGAGVTLRFYERNGREPVTLTLTAGGAGGWSGTLDRRSDGHRTITLRPF